MQTATVHELPIRLAAVTRDTFLAGTHAGTGTTMPGGAPKPTPVPEPRP